MFTKTTKRVISLILCLLMLSSCGIFSFAAVVETEEHEIARGNFRSGEGPTTKGYITEYQYSSPLEGVVASTEKFPVVFFIGKTRNNSDKGAELRETSFPLWSTDTYQKRFYDAAGAYIVLTRPQPIESYIGGLVENESYVRESLQAMITDFISKNSANIDMERIYLVSWDEGCKLATRLAVASPDLFSALVLISPTYAPTTKELTTIADLPIWLFVCKKDSVASFDIYGTKLWDAIKNSTAHSYTCRYTTFESFNTSIGKDKHHETWEYVAYDTNYTGEFSGAVTIDAQGRSYNLSDVDDGVISWLSKIGSTYGDDCTCDCHHATGWAKFLWALKMLISMMFKINRNRFCACGIAHF